MIIDPSLAEPINPPIVPETNWPSLVFSITNDDSFNLVWELANSKKPLIASSLITSFNNVASGGLETFKHFFNEVCLLGEATQAQRDNWTTLAESFHAPEDFIKVIKGI